MKERIFHSILWACLCALIVAAAGTVTVLYQTFSYEQIESLRSQTEMGARLLEKNKDFPLNALNNTDVRVSLIDANGNVTYDSKSNPANMENHKNRAEIIEAEKNGEGFSLRHSSTLLEDTYNAAIRLSDGSFLRLSRSHSSLLMLLGKALSALAAFIAAAIALSWFLAGRAAKNIVAPINAIDPASPKDIPSYEELDPLVDKLEENRKLIRGQFEELEKKEREFDLLSSHMDEGLLLLTKNGRVLSANDASRSIFNLEKDDRIDSYAPKPLFELIMKAREKGRSKDRFQVHGKSYHLEALRVGSKENTEGVLVLALDVSEKEDIQKRRQEFTANVTHELKTPLQTILSSAELLQKGIVSEKDIPVFAGYIHEQAARMSRMISDIIRISRLENSGPEPGGCSARKVIEKVIEDVRPLASLDGIRIEEDLASFQLACPPSVLSDLASSLIENAIVYNKKNGSVHVSLCRQDDQILFIVEDTGIGIDPDIQSRVFERFFTADLSHNKKGTGLGLAIAKHAAQSLSGSISLQSIPGKGTTFTVHLPASLILTSSKADFPASSGNNNRQEPSLK